jgi:polar amino acid transport system substrate-binding protein
METDKMATLGTLVSGIAHEINNPNNAIMFNLHIIKEILDDIKPLLDKRHMQSADFQVGNISYSDLPQSIDRLMKGMNRSSERIKHIVADLRNFAKPSPYNLEQWVQVNEVVRSSIVLLNNMIRVSTDNFSVDYSENLPKIKGNFQRLEQVIINLIQNACQSLENKGQGINVKTTHIREDKKESICITVADEGTGIPEKNLKYITDPFFTTKRDEGGTGLGLSITHRIIKDHNGTLDIQSKPGTGSVFTVNLPVIPSTASKSRRAQNEQ